MATIVTRAGKASPLTNQELDSNFNNLNTDKAELSGAAFTGAITTNSTIDGRDVAADGVTADAALPKSGGAMTGAITTNSTFDGRDVATDGTKLDGIESSATADQTGAQIKTAYEAETNAFTDAQFTKLGGIEASATADQTAAEIRALVESATDSNVFTDADHTKLNGVEASADVTDATNVTAAGALMDSELTSIVAVKALNQGVATGDSPTFAAVTANGGVVVDNFTLDGTTLALSSGAMTISGADDLTLDVAGNIELDADGGQVIFKDGGTNIGRLENSSSNFVIKSMADDKDIIFKGEDGGNDITALTLDMSAAGAATFNSTVTSTAFGSQLATTLFEQNVLKSSVASSAGAFIRMAVSNAGNPTYAFEDDTNTGMFTSGADTLNFSTAGTERMRIDASGNVQQGHYSDTTIKNFNMRSTKAIFNIAVDGATDAVGTTLSYSWANGGQGPLKFSDASGERMRISSSGYVGIGTDSPSSLLDLTTAGSTSLNIQGGDGNSKNIIFRKTTGGTQQAKISTVGDDLRFTTGPTDERMRIDSSGNLLVGTTNLTHYATSTTQGHTLFANGTDAHSASGGTVGVFNRQTSDGDIINLRKDGATVGSIGVTGANAYINSQGGTFKISTVGTERYNFDLDQIYPVVDNDTNLGHSAYRFKDIYATNGTIQTSDAREKTAVRELTDAEMRVAKKLSKNIGFFQWLTAIEKKGADARSHCGQTVQGVIAEFDAEGLDAFDYAMVCYNEWEAEFTEHPAIEAVEAVEAVEGVEAVEAVEAVDAVLDEDGEIVSEAVEAVEAIEGVDAVEAVEAVEAVDAWTEQTQEQGDRFSLRTDQLNHFMIRGLSQNQSELEARLSELEK